MPTYDYKCKDCGECSEVFQNMSDAPLTVCSSCGGELKRLLGTGAGIIFKGSGFYETDYRKDDYRKKAGAENKKSSDDKTSDDGKGSKTEQQPAAGDQAKPAAKAKTEIAAS